MLNEGSRLEEGRAVSGGQTTPSAISLPALGQKSSPLSEALSRDDFSPDALLKALREIPAIALAYTGPAFAGNCHYDLETHSRRVLEQSVKHFGAEPSGYEGGLFHLALSLHDIGKPAAIEKGSSQHVETVRIILEISDELPIGGDGLSKILALIDGDPLGNYLQGFVDLEETVREILERSARSSLPPDVFLSALEQYYQCDVSAYTRDAGSDSRLDHLFEWSGEKLYSSESTRRLPFVPRYLEDWDSLRQALAGRTPKEPSSN